MALQKLVELGAIALRQPRRLSHVAIGDSEDLRQILALEFSPRVLEGGKLALLMLNRGLHQRRRYDRRCRKRHRLLDDVVELAHIARSWRRDERRDGIRRKA